MKLLLKIFIITGFIFFYECSSAQVSGPYLDSSSTWYDLFGGTNGITTSRDYNKYYFDGDTTITGNTYYKLFRDQIDSVWLVNPYVFDSVYYYNHEYLGSLREDSLRRFYILYQGQPTEVLQYDFNLTVGDSLPDMYSTYGCNNPPTTIFSIDTVYLGTLALKKLNLPPGIISKSLYEGIGSSGGFIYAGSLCQAFESGACLVAYKKGADSLYINCGLGVTGLSEKSNISPVNVFPNPAAGSFNVEFGNPIKELQLTDVLGTILLKTKSISERTFHITNLKEGIYFLTLFDYDNKKFTKKIISYRE